MTEQQDYLWDPTLPADPDIAAIEAAVRPFRFGHTPLRRRTPRRRMARWPAVAVLAAASVLLMVMSWRGSRDWSVQTLYGGGIQQSLQLAGPAPLPGSMIRTDSVSAARLRLGRLGTVDLDPASELRVTGVGGNAATLYLARGTMHARIWAPPRNFVVRTSGATATDLGCVYSLTADSAGNGVLAVTQGAVALSFGQATTLVMAGMAAKLYEDARTGAPYPLDAPPAYQRAVLAADRGRITQETLSAIAAARGVGPAVTLVHLLPHVPSELQSLARRTIAGMVSPPDSGMLLQELDGAALAAWTERIHTAWQRSNTRWWEGALIRFGLKKPRFLLEARQQVSRPGAN